MRNTLLCGVAAIALSSCATLTAPPGQVQQEGNNVVQNTQTILNDGTQIASTVAQTLLNVLKPVDLVIKAL